MEERDRSSRSLTRDSLSLRSSSSGVGTLQRDVKGLADAQARLVRVIEDVSQELTQRLAQHDLQLEQLQNNHQALQDTFRQVQATEASWRSSLDAEYLRLRTSDGNVLNRINFLESKMQMLRPVDATDKPREELRLESLEARLSGQLSQQLEVQLSEIIRLQLQTHVQPQLQQQLQQQLQDFAPHEASRLSQEVKRLEQRVLEGQETLRQEALKREEHLSELQDAAQRLAQTAMRRAQASTAAHAQVFSASSSLAQRVQRVEGELLSFQRQEKEKHKRRIARLEEDLAQPQLDAPKGEGREGREGLRVDELRLQLYSELSDARNLCAQLGSRVSRCESDILELRLQVIAEGGAQNQGSRTPDFPSPWAAVSEGFDSVTLPALPTTPSSPAPSPPEAGSLQRNGVPEGPQLPWDEKSKDREHSDRNERSEGQEARPSTRFGVLPPPKVTPPET